MRLSPAVSKRDWNSKGLRDLQEQFWEKGKNICWALVVKSLIFLLVVESVVGGGLWSSLPELSNYCSRWLNNKTPFFQLIAFPLPFHQS